MCVCVCVRWQWVTILQHFWFPWLPVLLPWPALTQLAGAALSPPAVLGLKTIFFLPRGFSHLISKYDCSQSGFLQVNSVYSLCGQWKRQKILVEISSGCKTPPKSLDVCVLGGEMFDLYNKRNTSLSIVQYSTVIFHKTGLFRTNRFSFVTGKWIFLLLGSSQW